MKNTLNLIGIIGRIGSGKDTAGEMLMEKLGEGYKIKKYAGMLKDITCMLVGCTREQLESQEFKNSNMPKIWRKGNVPPMTYRRFMQLLGTEAGKDVLHPDIWTNSLFADYTEGDKWIITDVRYPEEADAILERGGTLIKLERFEVPLCSSASDIKNELWRLRGRGENSRYGGNSFDFMNTVTFNTMNNIDHITDGIKEFEKEAEYKGHLVIDTRDILIPDPKTYWNQTLRKDARKRFKEGKFIDSISKTVPDYHSSETGMDDYQVDYLIKNIGTLEELKGHIEGLVDYITIKNKQDAVNNNNVSDPAISRT